MSPAPRHGQHRRPSPQVFFWRRVVVGGGLLAVHVLLVAVISWASGDGGPAPTTTSTAGRVTTSTTTPRGTKPVTMAFVGDTMLGNTPSVVDPASYLAPVASALKAPIVFANLEGTLTDATGSKCGSSSTNCYAFRNPPSTASSYRQVGFTVMNSANNHSHDFGAQGVADTTAALQAAGIAQGGLPGQIAYGTEGSTKVAFVDFAPYANTNNLLDPNAAASLIAQARKSAALVVVYIHAGAEGSDATHVTGQDETYVGEDRGNAQAFAHRAIDEGADLVVGSGPHVLRGMEWYKGHLIAYSLGNFAGYQNFSTSGTMDLTGILTVTLAADGRFDSGHFESLAMTGEGQPTLDGSGQAASLVNQLSQADFGASGATIGAGGRIEPPPGG
jgi:poly-gamma-glutamate capsule biosynthesis protein CapA/YwtB (metallophosphatase superfamily)